MCKALTIIIIIMIIIIIIIALAPGYAAESRYEFLSEVVAEWLPRSPHVTESMLSLSDVCVRKKEETLSKWFAFVLR